MSHSKLPASRLLLPIGAALLLFGCGGGGSGGGGGGSFQVLDVNVPDNSVWQLNRAIVIRFSAPVMFSSVSLSTINIRQINGTPSAGEFSSVPGDPSSISFQPVCPRLPDYSDAGLLPGGVAYEIRIVGAETGTGITVKSTGGTSLALSEYRTFTTPNSTNSSVLFFDTKVGAPNPVVRTTGSNAQDATYIEVGGDPSQRIYYEKNNLSGVTALQNGATLPLNLLSDVNQQIALLLAFDQPVDPATNNISSTRLRWEFLDQVGTWTPMATQLSLDANCEGTGSLVRIIPLGVLPPDAQTRVVVTPEFRDLVGETSAFAKSDFAPAETTAVPPGSVLADAMEEEFVLGGAQQGSHEDITAALGEPLAEWGGGSVKAAFSFGGTGGLGGNFDWEVKAGQTFVLDTTSTTIVGGPNFVPTGQQVVIGGLVDVRNLAIRPGSTLRIQGPNPVVILASGTVLIEGRIELSGTDSKGVASLNTTSIPESGSTGNAGGGRGGTGSPLTNASDPRGGTGQGAFNVVDLGGQGGETGWNISNPSVDARRGAGGGGGVLGSNQLFGGGPLFDQTFIGLDAEKGFDNAIIGMNPPPLGAVTGVYPPKGGNPAPSPFADLDPNNDFYGTAFDSLANALILGELSRPWAGGGGGGGGDAAFTNGQQFPASPYDPGGDEKGSGAGGGGGALTILALGNITIKNAGTILARGGTGGGGENTNFLDRVGGGSGGGAGGHIVLQTASKIDMSLAGAGQPTSPPYVALNATGGEGGAGAANLGGAFGGPNGSQEQQPFADACPTGYPSSGTNACRGPVNGAGGDGGPGIIQLHAPGGLAANDILLPFGKTLPDLCKPTPVHTTATQRLIPTFGRTSVARSQWIEIGRGGYDAAAVAAPFYKNGTFEFSGIDPLTGLVLTTAGKVNSELPILPQPTGPTYTPIPIVNPPGLPSISTDGRTLRMDATALIGSPQEYYLTNPALLKRFVLELSQVGNLSNFKNFDVASATYNASAAPPTLSVTVSSAGAPLTSFTAGGGVGVALKPTFFRIKTNDVLDSLPNSASVAISFQATIATSAGVPDEAQAVPLLPGSDISLLNSSPLNPDFRFLRFQVNFNIDAQSTGLSPANPIPAVDFLRIPFRY